MIKRGRKNTGFVMVLVEMLDAPAWRVMSHGARSLYIALKRRYRKDNNGNIYLPQREAEVDLGSSRRYVRRWFKELEYYGFVVMTRRGVPGPDGKGRAPCWRLTEASYMDDPPTRDFMNWNGVLFGTITGKTRGTKVPHTEGHKSAPHVGH
jgi:hypothetical protein